jgi:hypothetical protein
MATAERLIIESMFRIADKEGNDVDFILNREQAQLDDTLSGRDVVPKARQLGISSYVLGLFLAACLSRRNTRAVVISHDSESTQRMLAKVHYMLDNIKGPKAVTDTKSKNEITFPKTNSRFYIGTAGSRKFGRGDTITHLHCSEAAFWENAKDLTAGLFQAVPYNGIIIIESTGNGMGNWYHRQCMKAFEAKGRYKLHFFNWLNFVEYTVQLTEEQSKALVLDLKEEYNEIELYQKFKLTPGQLMWRRYKLEELDYDLKLFKQEYPITLDECFQSTGSSWFHKVNYCPTEQWIKVDSYLWVYYTAYLVKRGRYVLGVDVGGGIGKDRSVIQVIDAVENSQVAEWVSDRVDPERLAHHIKAVAEFWGEAYVVVESNNHGLTTISYLKDIYPQHLIHSDEESPEGLMGMGFKTTVKTKPLISGRGKAILAHGFIVRSPMLKTEIDSFAEQESGKLEANEGCFDDRVMALLVGLEGMTKSGMLVAEEEEEKMNYILSNPFSLEAILQWAEKRKHGTDRFPVSKHILPTTTPRLM